MPIPNASWSGEASTAAASGVTEKRSAPSSVVTVTSFAAAWLYAHSRTHRSSSSVAAASSVVVNGAVGAASALYSPSLSPRWIIPDVTAPSSFVNTRNWYIFRASGSSVAMAGQ